MLAEDATDPNRQPAPPPGGHRSRRGRSGTVGRVAVFLLAAGLVVAYALPGGAYDIVVRQEYGLVIWCVIGLGAALGRLPRSRPSSLALIVAGGLVVYTLWVALSLVWTESAEQTTAELARAVDYLGMLVLIGCLVDRRSWRTAAAGLAFGAFVVCLLSVASRLDPGAFPANQVGAVFATDRLAYPFGYWNAVGAWGAMCVALGLGWSANDSVALRRAVALGFVPVAATMTYLSSSRAGVAGTVLGVIVVAVLSRHRWTLLFHVAVAAFGTALAIAIIRSHTQIAHATGSGGGVAVLAVLVFAGLLGGVAGALTGRAGLDRRRLPARFSRPAVAALAIVALLAAAAVGPHLVSKAWHQFRNPVVASTLDPARRLTSLSGTRYDLWKVALQAFEHRPLTGTGAGTYELWWNRHALDPEFVRNAHSIWFENLAELGVPGALAILVFVGLLIAVGVAVHRKARRRASAAASTALLAAVVVFVLQASVDWMWQSTAVTVLALAAVAILSGRLSSPGTALGRTWRFGLVAVALLAAAIQLPGLVSTVEVRRSQAAERRGDGATALAWARAAVDAEPWAASPYVQRGLVLESGGRLQAAAADLRTATFREPTNYVNWALLARVQTERGQMDAATRDLLRSYRLRPDSGLFQR